MGGQLFRPGEGERNALAGFVPQYKIFAALVLRALHRRELVAVSVADPEAGRLDDIQIETADRIDAYQVKWSATDDPVTPADFRDLLRDMIVARDAIQSRRGMRVVAHTHTSRPRSVAALRGQQAQLKGASLKAFVEEVWRPATQARFDNVAGVPERWALSFSGLADDVNVTPEKLLDVAPSLLFHFDQTLPDDGHVDDREGELYLADLHALTRTLFDIVSSGDRSTIRIETDDLLRRVGSDWVERGRFRAGGAFPPPPDYEEIATSAAELSAALTSHTSGYVFVLGSPGSGKSTLVTRALRSDDRLVASYYAYLPGDNTATRSEASTFLHDLVLALEERGFTHGATRPPFDDVDLLQARLHAQLVDVAAEARTRSGVAVILVDGLDHVGRDPTPARSLLQYLPVPESLPEGVLFVIGTRTADDLPNHVRPALRQADRVITIGRLSRRAVLDIAQRRGVGSVADEIWGLSGGHPLLMWMFIRLASALPEDERGSRLAEIAPSDGDVTALCEQLWLGIAGDDELVELFALVARIRVPFALSWLEETGTPTALVRRIDRFPHLVDTDDFGRSSFFHDSFRVFVRERTAERAGAHDPSLDRRLHRDLADRCARAASTDPVAWEEIHHRLAAADYEEVIRRATPAFFRGQLTALRPTSEVLAAVREATQAIEHTQDANAIVRLALAAAEAQSRGYNLPTGTDFLVALAELGRIDVALGQLDDIRDNVVGNDRRASALELALHLHGSGHERTALRVFEAYEPLELFGGPRSGRRQAPDGPWDALRAWAQAATVLRSPEYVLHQIDRLDLPNDRFDQADPQEALRPARVHLLLTAEQTAYGRELDPAPYREAVAAIASTGDEAWIDARCIALLETTHDEERHELQAELSTVDLRGASPSRAVDVVESLWRSGVRDAAQQKLRELRQPPTPESAAMRNDRQPWHDLYRFLRLKSALERPLEPTDAIRDSSRPNGEDAVYVARHLAALAALEGAVLDERGVAGSELVAVTDRFVAFWEARGHTIGMSGLRAVRTILLRAAIRTASRIGGDAVRQLFSSFERRWDEAPHTLRRDGWKLLRSFHGAGIGEVSISSRLDQIEAFDDLDVEEWLKHTQAWLEVGRRERAEQALARVVERSFTVGYRKDYQLSEWIPLLRPQLLGPDGGRLATWLAERLVALDEEIESGATHDAGRILVRLRAEFSLLAARDIARVLEQGKVLDTDDVVSTLLEASAPAAGQAWWLALRELLCPLGAPPTGIDVAVAAAAPNFDIGAELRQTVERVAVEGRPSLRVPWRMAICNAAASAAINGSEIGVDEADLQYSDESPSPEWGATTSGDEHDEQPRSLDEMLKQLESGETDYRLRSALRDAVKDAPEEFVARVLAAVADSDEEARFLAADAGRRHERGDIDGAWTAANAALSTGTARDWSRSWAGGPGLAAIAIMKSIDAEQTRPRIFKRFATLAAEDHFLLTEIAREIGDSLDLFAPIDRDELAQDVLEYLEELLGALPRPDAVASTGSTEDTPAPGAMADVFRDLTLELLASPYKMAWTTAQRAALELHRSGEPSTQLLTAALDNPAVPAGRVLALVEAEVVEARALDDSVVERVVALAQALRLDVREAAGKILDRCEIHRPSLTERPLRPSLRLELPARIGTSESSVDSVARAIDEILELHGDELSLLARVAHIDVDALREHVSLRAVRMDATAEIGRDRPDDLFGWAYVKPAARAVFAALAETAAEVVDAGVVPTEVALKALGLGAPYDLHLLLNRPQRRPEAVVAATPEGERQPFINGDWLSGLAGVEGRLARRVDDWHVIGERTLLRQLARQLPEEIRIQAVSLDDGVRIAHLDGRVTATTLNDLRPGFDDTFLVRGTYRPLESEQDWLALNPDAGLRAGFTADEDAPLAWSLNGAPAVRSLWWRSGFTHWDASSPHDEVSEGWFVLATGDAVARLRDVFPEILIAWSTTRTWRPGQQGEVSESRIGIRSL